MTFRQTLEKLYHSAAGGEAMGELQDNREQLLNRVPLLKQLLDRSTPEERKRIIDELKLRRRRQQQQQLQAQIAAATGDQSLGMKEGDLLSGILKSEYFCIYRY